VDITAHVKRIVFSGLFSAGADLAVNDVTLTIRREGKVRKLVREVEHVYFSGRGAGAQGQDITYVTERCVLKLTSSGSCWRMTGGTWSASKCSIAVRLKAGCWSEAARHTALSSPVYRTLARATSRWRSRQHGGPLTKDHGHR
jgi:hypothetical protein